MCKNTTKGIYTGFHMGENQNPWWVFLVDFQCKNRSLKWNWNEFRKKS